MRHHNDSRTALQIEYDETFYEHEGQSKTIAEWAKCKGVPFGVLSMWLAKGRLLEDAIILAAPKVRKDTGPKKRFVYDGQMRSVREIATITGIRKSVIYTHLRNGLSIDAAASVHRHRGYSQTSVEPSGTGQLPPRDSLPN